jgi:hypothetical protein
VIVFKNITSRSKLKKPAAAGFFVVKFYIHASSTSIMHQVDEFLERE